MLLSEGTWSLTAHTSCEQKRSHLIIIAYKAHNQTLQEQFTPIAEASTECQASAEYHWVGPDAKQPPSDPLAAPNSDMRARVKQ